jgi:predicted type IV restriction endonuclease
MNNVSQERLKEKVLMEIESRAKERIRNYIESLRAERDRYKAALEKIADMTVLEAADGRDMRAIAATALEGGSSND